MFLDILQHALQTSINQIKAVSGVRRLKDALCVFSLTEQQSSECRNLFLAPAHMAGGRREREREREGRERERESERDRERGGRERD